MTAQNNIYIAQFDRRFKDCMDSKRLNDLVELGNRFKMIQKILADAEWMKVTASGCVSEGLKVLKSNIENLNKGDFFDRIKLTNMNIEIRNAIELNKIKILKTTEFFKYITEHQELKQLFDDFISQKIFLNKC
jgi:hypothetical protein